MTKYRIVLPRHMAAELHDHLLNDRSREQMAIALCGVDRSADKVRLLGRHLIAMPPEAFAHQSAGGLHLHQDVQREVLRLAAAEGLSQIDFHTHPGDGPVGFSGIDDRNEAAMASYVGERLPETLYSSVVVNGSSTAARMWEVRDDDIRAVAIPPPNLDPEAAPFDDGDNLTATDAARFDRQLGAFGRTFQRRMRALRVGIAGVGGIGSVIVEQLGRLGVCDWVLVDPDVVEASNLNRLLGSTMGDADEEIAKVDVAARNVGLIDGGARVTALRCTVFTQRALQTLRTCDVLIAATDNDASRMVLNALAAQYLIPIVHAGVNLDVGGDGQFDDVSGEVAVPPLGAWCLLCAGMIDPTRAAQDLARPEERQLLRERGYLPGVAAPAVYHLNAAVASLAVAEIHNLVAPYRALRRYVIYRDLQGEVLPVEVPRSNGCLHCGPEGRLGLGDLAPLWRPDRLAAAALPAVAPDAGANAHDPGVEIE